MKTLWQDLRFGVKLLTRSWGFTLTAILTLALCIATNATIFSVINSVLLRPLPFSESDRIVVMYNSYPNAGAGRASSGVPDYYDRLRELDDLFLEQAFYRYSGLTIGEQDRPERLLGMSVTPSFFRLLKVEAQLGRTFTEEEGELGEERKVVLSHSSWHRLFGGEESVLGTDIRINANPYTIVGVLPEEFLYLNPDVEMWIPLAFSPEQKSDMARHNNSWESTGRLRDGATLSQVREQLNALTAANLDRFPEFREILINAGYHVQAHFLKDEVVRDIRGTLYFLWAGALFVLLIGCVNITNLVLVRTSVRVKELATRFALGATRWRIARQLLNESVLMTILGSSVGLFLGYMGLRLLSTLGVENLPRGSEVGMDIRVILVILAIAILIGFLIGILPIAQVVRWSPSAVFREGARGGTSSRGARTVRNALVVGQVAVALVLLIGAALLLTSFRRVLEVNPGFHSPETIQTGTISLAETRYPENSDTRAFLTRLLKRVRAIPGVSIAGAISSIPFGGGFSDSVILAEGYVMEPGESLISPTRFVATPGYFEAMGIPLVEGRVFDERDVADSQRTIIVDERLAKKFWRDSSALGKRLFLPSNPNDLMAIDENTEFLTVVGVVGEVTTRSLVDRNEQVGAYYFPHQQRPNRGMTLAVRSQVDPAGLAETIRREVTSLDTELPFYGIRTMQERLDPSVQSRRSPMLLTLGFSGLALFLAAVGIYGVLAYLVTQRTKEIGIRMAVGCGPTSVFELVQKEGLLILAVGLVVGLAGSLAFSRYVESLLFGVQPLDPLVLLSSAAILGVVAFVACAIPAVRATRINPVRALSLD